MVQQLIEFNTKALSSNVRVIEAFSNQVTEDRAVVGQVSGIAQQVAGAVAKLINV